MPFWHKLFGYPLMVIGGTGVIATISNMIAHHQSRLPGPAGLALATICLVGGITLIRAKPTTPEQLPKGAELTPSGEVSYDRQILQAMRAAGGRATPERIAEMLAIPVAIAIRELTILVRQGACRELEDGSFYFAEFADEENKRRVAAFEKDRT